MLDNKKNLPSQSSQLAFWRNKKNPVFSIISFTIPWAKKNKTSILFTELPIPCSGGLEFTCLCVMVSHCMKSASLEVSKITPVSFFLDNLVFLNVENVRLNVLRDEDLIRLFYFHSEFGQSLKVPNYLNDRSRSILVPHPGISNVNMSDSELRVCSLRL